MPALISWHGCLMEAHLPPDTQLIRLTWNQPATNNPAQYTKQTIQLLTKIAETRNILPASSVVMLAPLVIVDYNYYSLLTTTCWKSSNIGKCPTTSVAADTAPPHGYMYYPPTDKYYLPGYVRKNWHDSQLQCSADGATLMEFKTPAEREALKVMYRK